MILGRGGAYLHGAFHAWDMPDTTITELLYEPPEAPENMGTLRIEYTAQAGPTPLRETLIFLIPPVLEREIPGILKELEMRRE